MPTVAQEEKIYLIDYLKDTQEKLIHICKNTSKNQAIFTPSAEVWSIANNVEHLALVEKSLRKAVDFSLTQMPSEEEIASHTNSNNYVRKGIGTRGAAVKAPERVMPMRVMEMEESLALFLMHRQENIVFITETEADLHAHYWKHPFIGLLDAYQVFIMLAAHLERHIAQIEELRADENFPKS
jgi:uncharacterized damage-inducible protein DinB